jgi:uncharacterized surface protein with fasciclin (FAS1) repeats
MFNPFVPFHFNMIKGLRDMNRRYLVSQTYHQAIDHFAEDPKTALLLSDYEDLSLAKIHYNALTDKFRAILDLEKEKHREKLVDMLHPNSKYRVYAPFIKDMKQVEKRLNDKYSNNIRNYVRLKTNWRIGSDKTLQPRLQMQFGELFVILKYSGQEIRFKLEELEKY